MHVQHVIASSYMKIVAGAQSVPAFWAYPQDGMTYPGIVLIHAGWGLTGHIRTQARRLAESGYYVIAPDLFNGHMATSSEQAAELYQQFGPTAVPRIEAALNVLETHPHCSGRMGLIGWEAGGELAYRLAAQRNPRLIVVDAAVIFYARPDQYLAMLTASQTPILAFYGDADATTPAPLLEQLRAALAQAPTPGEVIVYPGASVGFFNETLTSYQATLAADAYRRMLVFLADHLDMPATPPTENPAPDYKGA